MTEEILTNEQSGDVVQDNGQYIEAIEQLKQNSVSKDKYAKLEAENKKLLNSLINGSNLELPAVKEPTDINALRKELFTPDCQLNNLQYVSKSLELRDALMEAGEGDPFLPWGKNINPTPEDALAAQKVADVYKECIEYADGDSDLFTQELMRRTTDAMPTANKVGNKNKQFRR